MIYIYGSYLELDRYGEARAQMPRDLQYRLSYLTGVWAEMCTEAPEDCAGVTPPFDAPRTSDPLLVVDRPEGTFIRLPVTDPPA